jgi:pimeloyl-ACP methyl ester carboxylesterase
MPEMVALNGFRMRFEIYGEGIPVVYTPGAFYRLESARPVAEALEALGYRVLLWDRPNTGGSDLLFEGDDLLQLWADKLHELLQHLRFVPAYVAGVANGLLASLHFAARYPTEVKGLILIAALTEDRGWWRPVLEASFLRPAQLIEEEGIAAALESEAGRWGVLDWREQFELAPPKQQQFLAMNPKAVAATLRAWAHGYTWPGRVCFGGLTDQDLARLDIPAIVFSGPDQAHSPDHARTLHQALPQSELVISAAYHGPRWDAILKQTTESDSFEYFAASLAGRINSFIRQVDDRSGARRASE